MIKRLEMQPSSNGISIGSYEVVSGECTVDLIATGQEVSAYEEDEWFISSPDGQAGIKVIPAASTSEAECLKTAQKALHW